jgi:sigma-E factor negative regulatory protein RseC
METEKGTVQRIENGWAWVETKRTGSCEECSQKGHCHLSSGGNSRMIVKAENVAQARTGDEVEIYLNARTKLKGLFMVYIFPVLGLLIGAISGKGISRLIGLNSDLGTVLAGFCGMAIAFFLARVLGFRMKENNELTPIVSRIIRRMQAGSSNPQIHSI